MGIDHLLGREHGGASYNCLHFADEVWAHEAGESLAARMGGTLRGLLSGFERLDAPVSPCLVLMRRPRSEAHVGVYLRGRVAHLTERGARLEEVELAALGFNDVRYYR